MVRKVVNCREKSARCKCSRTSYVCPRIRATERAYRFGTIPAFQIPRRAAYRWFPEIEQRSLHDGRFTMSFCGTLGGKHTKVCHIITLRRLSGLSSSQPAAEGMTEKVRTAGERKLLCRTDVEYVTALRLHVPVTRMAYNPSAWICSRRNVVHIPVQCTGNIGIASDGKNYDCNQRSEVRRPNDRLNAITAWRYRKE